MFSGHPARTNKPGLPVSRAEPVTGKVRSQLHKNAAAVTPPLRFVMAGVYTKARFLQGDSPNGLPARQRSNAISQAQAVRMSFAV